MKRLECTKEEFVQLYHRFCDNLNTDMDEYWITERDFAVEIFDRFVGEVWVEDIEREKRYAMYLELKKEFENNNCESS